MEELEGKHVLIVDDEERNLFALSSYLGGVGMETSTAHNGAETLRMLENELHPDIILLDMMMPVMDGYETLRALGEHNEYNKIPVIALTARAMKGDREKCMEAGAWDYLSKPVDIKLLMQTMKQHMV